MDSGMIRLVTSVGYRMEGGKVFVYQMISNGTFIKLNRILQSFTA